MTSSTQNSTGDFFGCKICCLRGVPVNESTIKAHLQTKGHKFMKILIETDLWPETSDSAAAASEPKIFRFVDAGRSTAILCRSCDCVLKDADLLFDHQLDESHKSNWSGPTVYFCPPCDVMLLGIESYSAHCTTSSHNKNLASAYQTSVSDDHELDYSATDKCSISREKSSSSVIPQKPYAEEKPEANKSIADGEDDPLWCIARKLAKSFGTLTDPKTDTTLKKPKLEDFQHETTTAAKSPVPNNDLKTRTTLSSIDFLQRQIGNEKNSGNREKIERVSKFLDFLTNEIREEKSIMQKQAEKIRKLENLAENYLNEKISLEKEQTSQADTSTKLAILMNDAQEQSIEESDDQSITVENSAKDKLLPSKATLQYSTQLPQSLATIQRAKFPSTAVKMLVGKRRRPFGSPPYHNKKARPSGMSNAHGGNTSHSSAGAQPPSNEIGALKAQLASMGKQLAQYQAAAMHAAPVHRKSAPPPLMPPGKLVSLFCAHHGYGRHSTQDCQAIVKNRNDGRCFFCRSPEHPSDKCDRACRHCGAIAQHRAPACPTLPPGAKKPACQLPQTSGPQLDASVI